ncbi:MarR family winged helix-turn-helix transcriptional regulator [Bacillus pumilus]|uniref:MarR family winged helix-turn-helix transcriptional regulator n=2 Tax=Bacillus pumilus TaxID=1408 RepID=UPI001C21E35E|nr:MarR family transcriptional regulator [Bacillus pumilus]MBU8609908.1 MarR family transcriptional regulator [Bacillus pumilus]MCW4679838.1 MarR family transcriptional regulator [Bacillus pumilus]MED1111648.1 MarR family transcriptional regulator [Bacillus pumilus]
MKHPHFFQEFVAFASTFSELKHDLMNKVKPANLTTLQYLILEQLAVSEPLTPSEIADCQHMSLPNVSRELKKLHEKQLIDKKEDPVDKRKHVITLSDQGRACMNEAFMYIEKMLIDRLSSSDIEQVDDIVQALRLLNRTIFKKKSKKA